MEEINLKNVEGDQNRKESPFLSPRTHSRKMAVSSS